MTNTYIVTDIPHPQWVGKVGEIKSTPLKLFEWVGKDEKPHRLNIRDNSSFTQIQSEDFSVIESLIKAHSQSEVLEAIKKKGGFGMGPLDISKVEDELEPVFEILSFKNKHKGYISTLRDNGHYVWDQSEPKDCPNGKGATLNDMLNDPEFRNHIIHSVKRLSDDEVFELGDGIGYDHYSTEIDHFEIDNGVIVVYDDDGAGATLDIIEHQKPLFTTYDGHNIYEGDEYYYVGSNDHVIRVEYARKKVTSKTTKARFKKEVDAMKWVEDRKPKYSTVEINKALEESTIHVSSHTFDNFWDKLSN